MAKFKFYVSDVNYWVNEEKGVVAAEVELTIENPDGECMYIKNSAKAVCSKNDTFDEEKGARYAYTKAKKKCLLDLRDNFKEFKHMVEQDYERVKAFYNKINGALECEKASLARQKECL